MHTNKEWGMSLNKRKLGDEVAALSVVCTLVLEPMSVALHTVNLLAVVVGNWVGDRVGRGVHAESSDSVKEFLLFCHDGWLESPVDQAPNTLADNRAGQPAHSTAGCGCQPENHEGVKAGLKNGILTVTVPKVVKEAKEEKKSRSVTVEEAPADEEDEKAKL